MTPAGNRGAPLSAALALLAAITLSTAVWAGVAVPRTAAVVREAVTQEVITTTTAGELLGNDGRYTILFLGSDKRCRKLGSPLGAERCSSLESKVSAASVEGRQHATSIRTSGQTWQMLHWIRRATVLVPSERM